MSTLYYFVCDTHRIKIAPIDRGSINTALVSTPEALGDFMATHEKGCALRILSSSEPGPGSPIDDYEDAPEGEEGRR